MKPEKTLLVTGGAGFIGANFVLEVLAARPGWRVINLDLLTYAGNLGNLASIEGDPRHRFVKGDLGDEALLMRLFAEEDIDAVVHFAAESHVDRSIEAPAVFLQTNVLGTFRVLQAALAAWKKAGDLARRRLVHVSTDEVYGSLGETGLFTETTAYHPNSPYSASKAASDHVVSSYFHTYGLPAIVTNCSNNYGPLQFPEKLVPLLIHNLVRRKPLPVYGDGRNVRDWLYVRDHCRALLTALERAEPGSHYNIGGWNEWANLDIVRLLCRLADTRLGRSGADASEHLITFVKDRPGHDLRYAIDASKIERELGWRPAETFETGIAKTMDWYLGNPGWLEQVTSGGYRDYYRRMYAGR